MAEKRPGSRRPSSAGVPAPKKPLSRALAGSPKPAERAQAPVSPARAAAFEILERVGTTSSHSDDLLHGPRLAPLSQADRDLTTALVMGVLRWQIALDARIRPLLSRPDARLAEPVALALRLGAFQLLHMERIPAHAALNESVELVRVAGHPHAAGMVNAILRKIVGAPAPRRPLVEPVEAMAERLGHPAWLVDGWVQQYGRAAAEAICTFDQQEPACTDVFGPDEDLSLPTMDAGSRLVAELAAVAAPPDAQRAWDCCAAPGGKTIVFAKRVPAVHLLATDSSPQRLKRLTDRLARHALGEVETAVADAAVMRAEAGFDLILCDVPCSGTGTLARNPEIRHRLQPEELKRQQQRQRNILHSALKNLAPHGRLLYSTCSLEREECEDVLRTLPEGFQRVSVAPLFEQLKASGRLQAEEQQWSKWLSGKELRTLPGAGFQGDGFFAGLIERL